MINITNTGVMPDWVALVEKNLRLPSGFDTELITHHLKSAIDYVERNTGCTIINKTVIDSYMKGNRAYVLTFKVGTLTSVKKNGEAVEYDDYLNSGFIKLKEAAASNDVVQIEYTSVSNYTDDHKNAVIMIASMYYNNPEGLGALDMRRINVMLTNMRVTSKI